MASRWDDAMRVALEAAQAAEQHGDVPIGAVVLDPAGEIIAVAGNERELHQDPTGHAEVVALRRAVAAVGEWRLEGCTMVVTLEPCTMCAGAIVSSRIGHLVFGAFDEKAGAVASLFDVVRDPRLNHQVRVTSGILAGECAVVLERFFRERRSV